MTEKLQHLHVAQNKIVTEDNNPIMLRGVGVGGYMNMENFINGYPGTETKLKQEASRQMGNKKAGEFFDGMADAFFAEPDVRFIKSMGANLIRLPLNYHHFEDDDKPFQYKQKGFDRVDKVIDWAAKHDIYVALDLHAVPGGQNPDWHSDNHNESALLWQYKHFQDREVEWWKETARRYKDNPTVAIYDIHNEPSTEQPQYNPNWEIHNIHNQRVVAAIRNIDPTTIIAVEGDCFGSRYQAYDGDKNLNPNGRLNIPTSGNIILSSHNYSYEQCEPGPYPRNDKEYTPAKLDKNTTRKSFKVDQQGYEFAKEHGLPLWSGEFGALLGSNLRDVPNRLRAVDDQMDVMNQEGTHWTLWTYKEKPHIGKHHSSMGLIHPRPDSIYAKAIEPIEKQKIALRTDWWMKLEENDTQKKIVAAADAAYEATHATHDERERNELREAFKRKAVGLTSRHLQEQWVKTFADMSDNDRQRAVDSWKLENCEEHMAYVDIVRKNIQG